MLQLSRAKPGNPASRIYTDLDEKQLPIAIFIV